MKNLFFQYNMRKDGKVEAIINNGIIVLDTNALLNVYRYNKESRQKYFEVLNAVNDRLFLTYQSVQEFYNNRLTIIYNKQHFRENLENELIEKLSLINNIVKDNNFTKKESNKLLIHEQGLREDIIKILTKAEDQIKEKINNYEIDIDETFIGDTDPILDRIMEIFDGRVNNEFTHDQLDAIYKEGKKRYKELVPPGYKDAKDKQEPACYGDLVIWKEMIRIAKEKKRDVLFVSDDVKEDWCLKFHGHNLGPRKELIKEFFCETEQNFHSITSKEFVKYISNLHNIKGTLELENESEIVREELMSSQKDTNSFNDILSNYILKLGDGINTSKFAKSQHFLSDYISSKYLDYSRDKYLDLIRNSLLNEVGNMSEMDASLFRQTLLENLDGTLSKTEKMIIGNELVQLSDSGLEEFRKNIIVNNIIQIIKNRLEKRRDD